MSSSSHCGGGGNLCVCVGSPMVMRSMHRHGSTTDNGGKGFHPPSRASDLHLAGVNLCHLWGQCGGKCDHVMLVVTCCIGSAAMVDCVRPKRCACLSTYAHR